MKIYVIEYYMQYDGWDICDAEYRTESFVKSQIGEFIERVEEIKDDEHTYGIKVYSGKVKEVDIDKVLNPF